ncbi:MAG: hypothetical protein ACLR1V_03970 [Coprococcus sp.]
MMDYVPGVDDVDHFDFDEKDIEHYRKVNEQEAARERQTQEAACGWRNSVAISSVQKTAAVQNQQRTEIR